MPTYPYRCEKRGKTFERTENWKLSTHHLYPFYHCKLHQAGYQVSDTSYSEIASGNVCSAYPIVYSNDFAPEPSNQRFLICRRPMRRNQFGALLGQAQELRALSTKAAADIAEPIEAHATN
jgi:hypothetical protein